MGSTTSVHASEGSLNGIRTLFAPRLEGLDDKGRDSSGNPFSLVFVKDHVQLVEHLTEPSDVILSHLVAM